MMDGVAYLIKILFEQDEIGQFISKEETKMEIFVTEESVSRSEWSAAGKRGLTPEYVLKTAAINYSGEKEIEYMNTRYAIYRTYRLSETDEIELYLQKKAGM